MSDLAIRVENLGKLYRIGERERYYTFRDTLANAFTAPFRWLRNGRQPTLENVGPSPSASNSQSAIRHPPSGLARSPSAICNPQSEFIWALKDVSFEIKQGEVVGVIGRNGAGKSTLLKILSRITEPTEGSAEIHGRVGSLLEVGTGFHPELTGRENIYLNGAILGMKKAEIDRRFDEIVAFAEVEKFVDTPLKHYSTGMSMRLAFAVAAHLEPEILLVDEVLAVGDAAFQKKCMGKMGDVAKEGRTVLFVSHNMFAVQGLCERGFVLESGRRRLDSGAAAVIGTYLHFGTEKGGEVNWNFPEEAPGDERGRLKAVRVVSEGGVTGQIDISKEFSIEIDYWNLKPEKRLLISIHLHNGMGICVMTVSNLPSASLTPDAWYSRCYPIGLFRTACTIRGNLLNDGTYTVSVYVNENNLPRLLDSDNIVFVPHVLSFVVEDAGTMRQEYTGKWLGVVRPMLAWQTVQLE